MAVELDLVRLTRLQAELRVDLAAIVARANETASLVARWEQDGSLPRSELIVVAVNLHGWYTAVECSYERVARLFDQSVPTGAAWHVELLSQMQIEIPGLRSSVMPPEVREKMHELRKFRHFFRNAYLLDLDPQRVRDRTQELATVDPLVQSGLRQLDAHIDALRATLLGPV
jgi:hypothetical protein